MENGKRRADDEGILIEYNPQKRVRHELIEFEPNGKDGAVMEIEVSPVESLGLLQPKKSSLIAGLIDFFLLAFIVNLSVDSHIQPVLTDHAVDRT